MTTSTTPITLYNTKTRRKEPFAPIDADNVRLYVCGPTVYDRAHLGNARPVIVFDTLFRLLRHVYGADHVTYVRNFTDVDDKINATALARQEAGATGSLEELIAERSDETIAWYREDMAAVGALEPTATPRATAYIAEMIAMIEELIAKGHAYSAEGHALFRVRSYKDYGALSGRSVDDMIAGARVEVAPYKEDPMDFVLWKPSTDDQPGWPSPWGRGRPGWHIECSAMALDLLGGAFDIHGGGNDLQFPHHENEIAQSTCAGHGFANVWMHNEMLQVEGKKMSKSLGNFFTVRDLLDQGVPGEVIRFVMLSTHYRKPMDWTEKKRVEAEKTLKDAADALQVHFDLVDRNGPYTKEPNEPSKAIVEALSDDLNTSKTMSTLKKLINSAKKFPELYGAQLRVDLAFLGFLERHWLDWFLEQNYDLEDWVEPVIEQLVAARNDARKSKNWAEADRIRNALTAAKVEITDLETNVSWQLSQGFNVLEAFNNPLVLDAMEQLNSPEVQIALKQLNEPEILRIMEQLNSPIMKDALEQLNSPSLQSTLRALANFKLDRDQ